MSHVGKRHQGSLPTVITVGERAIGVPITGADTCSAAAPVRIGAMVRRAASVQLPFPRKYSRHWTWHVAADLDAAFQARFGFARFGFARFGYERER
jgi:hypothetical protein